MIQELENDISVFKAAVVGLVLYGITVAEEYAIKHVIIAGIIYILTHIAIWYVFKCKLFQSEQVEKLAKNLSIIAVTGVGVVSVLCLVFLSVGTFYPYLYAVVIALFTSYFSKFLENVS